MGRHTVATLGWLANPLPAVLANAVRLRALLADQPLPEPRHARDDDEARTAAR